MTAEPGQNPFTGAWLDRRSESRERRRTGQRSALAEAGMRVSSCPVRHTATWCGARPDARQSPSSMQQRTRWSWQRRPRSTGTARLVPGDRRCVLLEEMSGTTSEPASRHGVRGAASAARLNCPNRRMRRCWPVPAHCWSGARAIGTAACAARRPRRARPATACAAPAANVAPNSFRGSTRRSSCWSATAIYVLLGRQPGWAAGTVLGAGWLRRSPARASRTPWRAKCARKPVSAPRRR